MKKDKTNAVEKKSIGFSLVGITTKQFAIIAENYDVNDSKNTIQTTTDFGIDDVNKGIEVLLEIRFKQKKQFFLICQVACAFTIDNNAWERFFVVETNEIIFPRDFIMHLVVLTIGTIRGVLHTKMENTNLNKFVLPTLNVTELITKDITFKL
jgi:hypothetical protein